MKFEIFPHQAFGPIKLHMNREEIKSEISKYDGSLIAHSSDGNVDYYFDNALQIEFNSNKVDFIGVSHSSMYTVIYKSKNVFDMNAEELFNLLASNDGDDYKYNTEEQLFNNLVITLWDADEQYDYIGKKTRKIWGQIGIGTSAYLNVINS